MGIVFVTVMMLHEAIVAMGLSLGRSLPVRCGILHLSRRFPISRKLKTGECWKSPVRDSQRE